MKNVLTFLCIFLLLFNRFTTGFCQEYVPQVSTEEDYLCLAATDPDCPQCYCTYPQPGCYPSAPSAGTCCGVSYLSMGIAIGLVVGLATIILSSENAHGH